MEDTTHVTSDAVPHLSRSHIRANCRTVLGKLLVKFATAGATLPLRFPPPPPPPPVGPGSMVP